MLHVKHVIWKMYAQSEVFAPHTNTIYEALSRSLLAIDVCGEKNLSSRRPCASTPYSASRISKEKILIFSRLANEKKYF